jgi:hypothetical protein
MSGLSERFTFRGQHHVEFASGIVLYKEDIVISFGIMDREALLARVPLISALGSLK